MIDNNRYNPKIAGRRSGLDRRVSDYRSLKGIERRVNDDRRKGTREREHPRYRAKNDIFVKLKSESKTDVGQLIDISMYGLAVLHTLRDDRLPNYSELGIFSSDDDFFVDQIPFQIVSDIELANEIPFSTISYRRYAVQFGELAPEQTEKLDDFLLNHTVGEA